MTAIRTRPRDYDVTALPYNAKGDGVTNDTASIQAAIDAAAPHGGTVFLPPGTFMFSNLKVYAHMRFIGSGMEETKLKRIGGSTGTAIREKTLAEGNPDGGTGLWMKDFIVDGNSTTGDGIDVGNQVNGLQLNFNAGLENIHVRNFTSGTGIRVRGNAVQCTYLWSNQNDIGINTQGGGNKWFSLLAEHNTTRDIKVQTGGDSYFGIQIETNGVTIPLEVLTNQNGFFGIYIALGANQTKIIQESTGAARNSFYDVFISDFGGAFTYTHGIYVESNSMGTGSTQYRIPYFLSTDGYPAWVYDQGTNISMKISGLGIESQPAGFASIGTVGAFDTIHAGHLQGGRVSTPQTFLTQSATVNTNAHAGCYFELQVTTNAGITMAAPTNAVDGQRIIYDIRNMSGGAMGTVTWNAIFTLATTFVEPAAATRKMIEFIYNNGGTHWVEVCRSL